MKLSKLFAVVCCVAIGALLFTSCESTTQVTKAYAYGIYKFSSSSSTDLSNLSEYLNSKGCPTGNDQARVLLITDSSIEKCDKKAAAAFEEKVKNLSREEVARVVSSSCEFMYGLARSEGPDSESVYVGKWEYPGK